MVFWPNATQVVPEVARQRWAKVRTHMGSLYGNKLMESALGVATFGETIGQDEDTRQSPGRSLPVRGHRDACRRNGTPEVQSRLSDPSASLSIRRETDSHVPGR